jgi:hypothetical protein
MKKLFSLIAATMITASLYAGTIDGKWRAETKIPEGKGKFAGGTLVTIFDLKSDGGKLAGTVTATGKKRERTFDIQNGKLDGDKFTFTMLRKTKKGERMVTYSGIVNGDELKCKIGAGR